MRRGCWGSVTRRCFIKCANSISIPGAARVPQPQKKRQGRQRRRRKPQRKRPRQKKLPRKNKLPRSLQCVILSARFEHNLLRFPQFHREGEKKFALYHLLFIFPLRRRIANRRV